MRFCYDSDVRGYHVYKDVWEASHGELLNCERETGNSFDPFAVCVKKHDDIVGHVSKKNSGIYVCCFFGVAGEYNVKLPVPDNIRVTFHRVD